MILLCHREHREKAAKDESCLVIYIDFKTDLIDLFNGNKSKQRNQKGSKFDKGIPQQSSAVAFNRFYGFLKGNIFAAFRANKIRKSLFLWCSFDNFFLVLKIFLKIIEKQYLKTRFWSSFMAKGILVANCLQKVQFPKHITMRKCYRKNFTNLFKQMTIIWTLLAAVRARKPQLTYDNFNSKTFSSGHEWNFFHDFEGRNFFFSLRIIGLWGSCTFTFST